MIKEDIMLKKVWSFIKENVPAIITLVTAILTVVYAALRLCIYVYWNGYFTRLNIDASVMNLDFDKSIFAVIFVSIVLLVVLFFMAWAYEITTEIIKKEKELQLKKIFHIIKALCKALIFSFIILSIINVPLIMLLTALTHIKVTICNGALLFLLLYFMELLFIFTQIITTKQYEKKEKLTERDVAIKIIQALVVALFLLAALFYAGTHAINEKNNIQLVENGAYMITYCDGEHYVLHRVKYEDEIAFLDKNEQKIVNIEDYEISIKQVKKIVIEDE